MNFEGKISATTIAVLNGPQIEEKEVFCVNVIRNGQYDRPKYFIELVDAKEYFKAFLDSLKQR